MKSGEKKAQVWIETVVYTLVALAIIGLFLTFAKPKIEEIQDKAIVEQSVTMLEDINSVILTIVQGGVGNQRIIEIGIKKGDLKIDSINNQIVFQMDGRYAYTEPGANGQDGSPVNVGNVIASTKKIGSLNEVTLISNYSNLYNITYQGGKDIKVLNKAPVAYKLMITNRGNIDISVI
jgi:hypothetical protein